MFDHEAEPRSLRLGDEVPNFTLKTFDPQQWDFDEFSLEKNKVANRWTILFFYPADFTFVGTTEHAALAEQFERFARMKADIVTVSCDTEFVHLAWRKHEPGMKSVNYPMAADPTGEIARLFGVLDEESGTALRGTFIINPEGRLLSSEINYFNVGRNIDELMRKFKAFLHVSRKPEKACPSKWKDEGDPDLEPSAKLVGNVYSENGEMALAGSILGDPFLRFALADGLAGYEG